MPAASSQVRALDRVAAGGGRVIAAERSLREAVSLARVEGVSWHAVGAVLGMTGEGARRKFGQVKRGAE